MLVKGYKQRPKSGVVLEKQALLWPFFTLSLVFIGQAFLFSAYLSFGSPYEGYLLNLGLSILVFLLSANLPLARFRSFMGIILLFSLFLLFLHFIPGLSYSVRGANRWLKLGSFSLQTSEFVKVVLVFYLAHFFDKHQEKLTQSLKIRSSVFLRASAVGFFFFVLILLQNDYSSSFILLFNLFLLFWFLSIPWILLLGGGLLLIPLLVLSVLFAPYRVTRFLAFLFPQEDPAGRSYQILKAQEALESGGFLGQGLGDGIKKFSVPELVSDFVFINLAEDIGFLGVMLVVFLWLGFVYASYCFIYRQSTLFHFILGCGAVHFLFLQVLFNLAVVAGLLPPTGINFPFFSSGGSSLIASSLFLGILYQLYHRVYFPKEPEDTKNKIQSAFSKTSLL